MPRFGEFPRLVWAEARPGHDVQVQPPAVGKVPGDADSRPASRLGHEQDRLEEVDGVIPRIRHRHRARDPVAHAGRNAGDRARVHEVAEAFADRVGFMDRPSSMPEASPAFRRFLPARARCPAGETRRPGDALGSPRIKRGEHQTGAHRFGHQAGTWVSMTLRAVL